MTRAVVFAYHGVGVRCLRVLLAHGVDVPLVLTHQDDPKERVWFASVGDTARERGIATLVPGDPNAADVVARVSALAPDFLFSFYYRAMLKAPMLATARRGALNMHGSLLPRYRGRAPVNWAVLHGERETGATLHYMTERPDAGDIVAQSAVPILPDDTASEVLDKVTVAAELALHGVLPALIAGTAPRVPQDLTKAREFYEKTVAKGNAAAQARRCFEIIDVAIRGLGGKRSDIVRTRILLTRMEDWEQVASVHGEFFGGIRPANTVMQVVRFIDPDWLVEIEADAVVED